MLGLSLLALGHSHHSGEGSSGGSSNHGHRISSSQMYKTYSKHLIGTTVISEYKIWNKFLNAIYIDFLNYEVNYDYNLYYYNLENDCLYFDSILNYNNETKIDGSSLNLVKLDLNKYTNSTLNFNEDVEDLSKFCDGKINSYNLLYVFTFIFILVFCCSCFLEDNTNRNMF